MSDQALPTYFGMTKKWQWPSTQDAIDAAIADFQAGGHEVEVAVVKVIENLLRDGGAFGFPINTDRGSQVNSRERCANDLAWSLRQESGFDESLQPLIARMLFERAIDICTTELRMNRPAPRLVQSLRDRVIHSVNRYADSLSNAATSHDDLSRAHERFQVLSELAIECGSVSSSAVDRMWHDAQRFAAPDTEREYGQWAALQAQPRRRLTCLCKRGWDRLTALFRGSLPVQATGCLASGTVTSDSATSTESPPDDKVRRVAAAAAVRGGHERGHPVSEPVPADSDRGAGPKRPVWLLAQWAAVTLVVVWIAPFVGFAALLGGLAAVGSLIGITIADLHGSAVGVATLASEDWSTFGALWHEFALCCSICVLGWRVVRASPVRRKREAIAERLDRAAASALSPLVQRFGQRLGIVRASPRAQAIVVAAVLLVGMQFLDHVGQLAHDAREQRHEQRGDAGVEQPVVPPVEQSAALVLRDGGIRSGHAAVEQHGVDTYVVSFRHAGKHQ